MIRVAVHTVRSTEVPASPDEAYALVADVARSGAHFPKLESLTEEGPGWVWRLQRIGTKQVSAQTVYGCVYSRDPEERVVRFRPMEGVGNARVEGSWTVEPAASGARMTLETRFEITLELIPRLLQPVAQKIGEHENGKLVEGYLENLRATLSGGDGRAR